jgi:hypothetical protein
MPDNMPRLFFASSACLLAGLIVGCGKSFPKAHFGVSAEQIARAELHNPSARELPSQDPLAIVSSCVAYFVQPQSVTETGFDYSAPGTHGSLLWKEVYLVLPLGGTDSEGIDGVSFDLFSSGTSLIYYSSDSFRP